MHKILGALIMAATFAILAVAPASAQTKAVPKTLLENAKVSVLTVTYAPGEVLTAQAPDRVIYIVQGPQKFKLTLANGKSLMQVHKTGDAFWVPAGKSTVTNVGPNSTTVLAVFVKK